MDDRPEIPGYRFLEPLGTGGTGTVWLADDEVSGRRVAVKILADDAPPEERERLAGWETAAREIRHPGLAKVIRAGERDGRLFVVMEHVPGRDLGRRVEVDGPLSEAEALDVAAAVARGLREARRAGIVHGDLNPANILVTDRGGVKVCDVGLARPGRLAVGAPAFVAPEQILGAEDVDERADIYALGLTLWFAVTGELPFPADGAGGMAQSQVATPLPDPRERRGGLSEGFADLIVRMGRKDPAERPADWDALLAEIDALHDDTGPVARRVGAAGRLLGRRDVRISLALLAVAAIALLAVLAFRGGGVDDAREREVAAEAAAFGALEEIDRRLAARPGEELEAYDALRELIARYPTTEAGQEALARVKAIRVRLEDLRRERFEGAMAEARRHAAAREFDRGIAALRAQLATLGSTEWGPFLEEEIGRIEDLALALKRALRDDVERLLKEGKARDALRRLDAAPYERAGGLAEWIDLERDRIRLELDR